REGAGERARIEGKRVAPDRELEDVGSQTLRAAAELHESLIGERRGPDEMVDAELHVLATSTQEALRLDSRIASISRQLRQPSRKAASGGSTGAPQIVLTRSAACATIVSRKPTPVPAIGIAET